MTTSSRTWRLLNVKVRVGSDEDELRRVALAEAGIESADLLAFRIARRSVDARVKAGRRRLAFNIHVDLTVAPTYSNPQLSALERKGRVIAVRPNESFRVNDRRAGTTGNRVAVVGAGPAGLYAAYVLALNGIHVDLIDRGARLDQRGPDVVGFHRDRRPHAESNLLFGEGGAGTYSDGKLYTRVDDALEVACLNLLVECGADPQILFDSRAHIGTDRLHRILPQLRERMEAAGVHFHWRTRMSGLRLDRSRTHVVGIETNQGVIECDGLFLAPGHSARDTIQGLLGQGVAVEAKPFQLGVRIEHPQALIDHGRYGDGPDARALGAAYYNLVCKAGNSAAASHTFCMCPGGKIVASVNEAGLLCTNGMSNSMHSSPWANAAMVTTFGPTEFGTGPLDGIEFQRTLERAFFVAGGSDYTAPAQRADDFLAGRLTRNPRRSSYTFGTCPGRIDQLLPVRARDALARALLRYEGQIKGFAGPEGLLVGLESRSSGPVRLPRDRDTGRAVGFDNLFPIGEGAGYAGGIMSAAIDGARAAKLFLSAI